MNLEKRINILTWLGRELEKEDEHFEAIKNRSYHKNNWLTVDNINLSLENIQKSFLQKEKLEKWISNYLLSDATPKRIGIIMIGNVPLANFYDLLCVFVSGHHALIKLSEDDKFILPYLVKKIITEFPEAESYFSFIEKLESFDAVIANGNKEHKRYFKTYFGKYPNIIRENKYGIAVLEGNETAEDLTNLGKDFFSYFGLGRRNLSKIYIPEGYDFVPLLEAFHEFNEIVLHNKYKNNFDYNYTLHLLNNVEYKANGCVMLLEDELLQSRISNLHFEYFSDKKDLLEKLENKKEEIECIISKSHFENYNNIFPGEAVSKKLEEYPDEIDVMSFLNELA